MSGRHVSLMVVGVFAALALVTTALPAVAEPPPDAATAAALQEALDGWRDEQRSLGATARVVVPGGFEWSGASGLRDLFTWRPITPDEPAIVGSSTKPVTATVVLQLVDEGRLRLDDPIADWYPDYPHAAQITLRHLLAHRSGIPEVATQDLFFLFTSFLQPWRWWTPRELVDWTTLPLPIWSRDLGRLVPRAPAPVGTWGYAQANYHMAAAIVERVTGRPFAAEVQERIVAPLGLTHTYLPTPGTEPPVAGLTNLFGILPFLLPTDWALPVKQSLFSGAWTAAGLVSTAADLNVFLRALFEGRLLSAAALAEMTTLVPIPAIPPPDSYGLGLFSGLTPNGSRTIGHGGVAPGFRTVMEHVPDLGVFATATLNTDSQPLPGPPEHDFVPAVVDVVRGAAPPGSTATRRPT